MNKDQNILTESKIKSMNERGQDGSAEQPAAPNNQRFNFNLKLFAGGTLLVDQVIHLPLAKLQAVKDGYNGCLIAGEHGACEIMFELEKAVNSFVTYHDLRCHVDQLPSDIPAGVVLEKEEVL